MAQSAQDGFNRTRQFGLRPARRGNGVESHQRREGGRQWALQSFPVRSRLPACSCGLGEGGDGEACGQCGGASEGVIVEDPKIKDAVQTECAFLEYHRDRLRPRPDFLREQTLALEAEGADLRGTIWGDYRTE